jgi:hypothetical protein
MSRRERASPGGPKGASRAGGASSARPETNVAKDSNHRREPSWEEIYQSASAAQQQELLALAERQGVIYFGQLPVPTNGAALEPERRLLTRLLNGQTGDLETFHAGAVEFRDQELDAVQREAVAKALDTPDVCLVQGLPGTGKSRVVAELVIQAAARGQRVLLLAPTVCALDRILPVIATSDLVFPVRCLDRDESAEKLPAVIRALTLAERLRSVHTQALEQAKKESEAVEHRWARLRQSEPPWEVLLQLAGSADRLRELLEVLAANRERLQSDVEREATGPEAPGFLSAIAACSRTSEEQTGQVVALLSNLTAQLQESRKRHQALHADLESMRPVIEAKEHGRWWTSSWWRATLRPQLLTRWSELDSEGRQVEAQMNALSEQAAALEHQRQQIDLQFRQEKSRLMELEVLRRRGELDARLEKLKQELDEVTEKWQSICGKLDATMPWPATPTLAVAQNAQTEWQKETMRAEEQRLFARQWAVFLEQNKQALHARIPDYVNVVAATTSALPGDPVFGDGRHGAGSEPLNFDLLILEDADQVPESELLHVCRRARRWVLVGEPAWHDWDEEDRRIASTGARGRAPSESGSQPFERLWRQLHCDPQSLPYAWTFENDRLCCRMRPVRAEDRAHLESERVADFADIELRILTLPGGRPILAEILFPPAMAIEQAKEYVYRELEELPIRASNHSLRWVEESDRIILRLADCQHPHEASVALEPGVREMLGKWSTDAPKDRQAVPWQSCCLEFDRSAGWQRRRAEQWVHQHLGLRDLGRTVRLDTLHRMDSKLAGFLCGCLFGIKQHTMVGSDGLVASGVSPNGFAAVEFVAVPSLKAVEGGRRNLNQRQESVVPGPSAWPRKGGAGLELDLTDPRNRERLPPEIRTRLPSQGFVNYPEGQAVVQGLATVAAEIANGRAGPRIAVLALYPAQVELIRQLIQQSPLLADLDVEVVTPNCYRQREADVVLLSLTRSHSHRPVAFGDGPRALALALTRARSKLVLFGDPGTLMRRSQWDGPLEHLNETTAALERTLIARLVRHLEPPAGASRTSRPSQGNGT